MRKSLLEAHLPFELADKMEKEGIRTIGAIPSIEFNKLSQGLKSNEEKTLQKMHYDENSSNQQQLRIREEAERKSLLEKIDKANQLIREINNNPSVNKESKMVELSSLLKLPQWTIGDSTSIENALENVKTGLAEVCSHLISSRMSTLSNEDLISNVSSGSALRGLVVGLMPSTAQVIKQAVSPLVMKPDFCTITLVSMANKMKTFTFKSQNSATDFQKTIDSTGANYGVQLQASGWGFAVEGDLKHRNHSKNEEKLEELRLKQEEFIS